MTLLKSTGCFLFVLVAHLSFGQNTKSNMSIELSIPHSFELPRIKDCSGKNNIYVIIHNNTDTTNYFYEDWNSFGYYNISFEIKYKDSIYTIVRPQKLWYRNFKSHLIVHPNESLVFAHTLIDTACASKLLESSRIFEDGWIGFPSVSDTVEIRGIYQLCDFQDTLPNEDISRLNYGRDFYIDFLDDDIESEQKVENREIPKPKLPNPKPTIIFHEPLISEWQTVIL
jgi:hypothetical protein